MVGWTMPTALEVRTGEGGSMEAIRRLMAVSRHEGGGRHCRRKTGPDGSVEATSGVANGSVEERRLMAAVRECDAEWAEVAARLPRPGRSRRSGGQHGRGRKWK